MPKLRPGVVSVVLVNFRGADDTIEAIGKIGELDWDQSKLEIVVVENASGDDSAERIRAAAPHVKLIVSPTNDGFAGGCNRGVAASTGEFIALLNNDAKPDSQWIRAAVERFAESPKIGAVASKVLDWEGNLVDYIDSAMTWYGMGYKPFTAESIPKSAEDPHDVLFGTGSAMFVRRSVFDELGGFDERFFMFFEDVDLGWRLNLLGYRYAYEPKSFAFHKHHASMKGIGSFKESYLLERNALFTLYKNLDTASLNESLAGAMSLAVRRGITLGGVDSTALDLRRAGGDDETTAEISKQALAVLFAIDQFVEQLPGLKKSRDAVQASRAVTDPGVWPLFGLTDVPIRTEKPYVKGYENIVSGLNVALTPATRRVLVITGDPIGRKLAGPAIRAWNMADLLSRDNDVKLVSLSGVEEVEAPFGIVHVRAGDNRAFGPLEQWADVIVFQGHAMAVFDALQDTRKILVVDIYDPMHLEQLEQGRELPPVQWVTQVGEATEVLNEQMRRGDFFLCASDRQRMFWLGQLAALGRINPQNYVGDPDLEGLIAVAPFGLSTTPPTHERDVLKGVLPGIGQHDKVLIWSGGLYNWFDPQILISAVADLSARHPDVRLFFQGTKHPHPGVPEMEIVSQSRDLAKRLGVLDSAVFFNESWVDYADRQNYLTEADAGVSTHFAHIETTFSFRTRILDYLWAGLPMVVTEGDHFAELISTEKLGITVPAGDIEALVAALDKVLFDEEFIAEAKKNIARVREQYYWETALAPLVEFVRTAHHAGDNARLDTPGDKSGKRKRKTGLARDVDKALFYLRNGGALVVAGKLKNRLWRR